MDAFVGAFLAKISKGRTIREFIVGVMLVPTAVSLVWFSVLGGAAIDLQRKFVDGAGGADIAGIANQESQMFTFLQQFPWAGFTSVLVVVLVAIFFVSGADASSIVMGSLSSYGVDEPQKWLVALWGGLMGLVAIVLFFAGGLEALQDITIIAAAPFLVVMALMAVALVKDLARDPKITSPSAAAATAATRSDGRRPRLGQPGPTHVEATPPAPGAEPSR